MRAYEQAYGIGVVFIRGIVCRLLVEARSDQNAS